MTMRPLQSEFSRQNLFDDLCRDEGVEYKIYEDHLGYRTFGVGHLIKEGDPEEFMDLGDAVSEERVWEAFEADLEICITECERLYREDWGNFPGEVQEILCNMMFNMGRTRLSQFKKMNTHLSLGNWSAAALEGRDSRWYRQVTNRAERLMVRLENIGT